MCGVQGVRACSCSEGGYGMSSCPYSDEELEKWDSVTNPLGDACHVCDNCYCEHWSGTEHSCIGGDCGRMDCYGDDLP